MIARSTGLCRQRTFETEVAQVQFIDEQINRANRVVLLNPVIQQLREQNNLRSILTIDVSAHASPQLCDAAIVPHHSYAEFSHSLGRFLPRRKSVKSGPPAKRNGPT